MQYMHFFLAIFIQHLIQPMDFLKYFLKLYKLNGSNNRGLLLNALYSIYKKKLIVSRQPIFINLNNLIP